MFQTHSKPLDELTRFGFDYVNSTCLFVFVFLCVCVTFVDNIWNINRKNSWSRIGGMYTIRRNCRSDPCAQKCGQSSIRLSFQSAYIV